MKRIFLTLTFILFVIPFGIAQDLPSYIPTDGLVAYYPFNGNANDESGNGHHGTVTDATLTYDRFDNVNSAYSFDGDGDYITSTSNVGVGQTTLTFSFWAKTAYGSKRMAVLSQHCETDCDNAFGLVLNKFLNSAVVCDDGHMGTSPQSFGYAQPAHYATVRTTTANSGWNNYVLVVGADNNYSYSNFRFYVNGIEQTTNCDHNWGSWQYNFPDYPLLIGNKPNSIEGFFHGQIDDIAIWDRALSDEEVYNLYDLPADILLDGVISAENNQIKNVADPTDSQDAATKNYVDNSVLNTYTQEQVDALIQSLQGQIDTLNSQVNPSFTMNFENYFDFETGEICTDGMMMGCESRFDLYIPAGGGNVRARLWWNESAVDVALVYDKTFEEISLNDVSSYYFCEHINDANASCANTDSPPTDFIGIYLTSEENYYAVQYVSETDTQVTFKYRKL